MIRKEVKICRTPKQKQQNSYQLRKNGQLLETTQGRNEHEVTEGRNH